jgi:hypothetical protein
MPKLQEPKRFVKASAHELGHGAFGLEHPFTHNQGMDEFGMANLMSWNPTARKLCKYQWDLIQHPAYWLQGKYGSDESEAMVALDVMTVFCDLSSKEILGVFFMVQRLLLKLKK